MLKIDIMRDAFDFVFRYVFSVENIGNIVLRVKWFGRKLVKV